MGLLPLQQIDSEVWPLATLIGRVGSLVWRFRRSDGRPLIVRPGGMGDLILLCVAAEDLGLDPRNFFWLIERRSRAWAQRRGLDYCCYDDGILSTCRRRPNQRDQLAATARCKDARSRRADPAFGSSPQPGPRLPRSDGVCGQLTTGRASGGANLIIPRRNG